MCRCVWGGDSGSVLQHWQNAGDDGGNSARGDDGDIDGDDGYHGPTGHGKGVCCCVPTHSPLGA